MAPLNKSYNQPNNAETRNNIGAHKDKGLNESTNSYAHVVKGSKPQYVVSENIPALTLDDSCLNQHNYTCCLMGKVKEFASLSNLKMVLANEGVLGACQRGSWLEPDFMDDNNDENDTDIESNEGEFIGDELKNDAELEGDSDAEVVPDTKFDDEVPLILNAEEPSVRHKEMRSEDPFNLYELLNKKKEDNNTEASVKDSLKYPLGFKPRNEKLVPKEHIKNHAGLAQKAKKYWVKELCMTDKVNFLSLQETKMENMDLFCIKRCWGNFAFDYVHSDSVGDMVVMGDFNEVCKNDERFGSVFNVQGADTFNLFIAKAGLEEVPLGGCSFTWCHKSASKMSKLDCFLIFESLMNLCPNISAISLRIVKFFHYWFELQGFDKLVEDSWNEAAVVEPNAMIKLMKKLKFLKEKIRLWNNTKLADLNVIIDKGDGDDDIVNKRTNVVRTLQDLEKLHSLEMAQKSKIKWAIEGDENSKYYHNILNKKGSQLAICGILVDGIWIDSPFLVKREFLNHFKKRFEYPQESRLHLKLNFQKTLTSDQLTDLECEVSKDEIKRAVWDCGTDKSPGPDGLTFGFYRRYWKIIESDVVEAGVTGGDFVFFSKDLFLKVVDFEKAFNSVRWDYLDDILRRFGFGEKWCTWIQSCLRSSRGSVIVNGSPTEEFQFHKGMFKGIMLNHTLHLSHLFYADVAIFMSQWNESNIDMIIHVLECFYRASGLRINTSKSKLMGVSVDAKKVVQAARKIFKVPMKILQRMESIRSHFFHGHDHLSKKPTWLKWKNALVSKDKGGLGISSLHGLNRALIFKWVWHFLSQNSSLWASVIKSIHGDHGKIGKWVKAWYPSIWLDIVKEVNLLANRDLKLLSFIHKKLGNGSDTSFWEDAWHGDIAFKNMFPRAYALETCKTINVASKLSHDNLSYSFRRDPRGGVEQEAIMAS
ncbi:RNA-directed DNA polymerase, eukaryota, reverse transcriptase zinc-binding domain protein [Tanacetum coccineum]|uniref:RNA-directed DNA polymerase, eukaryota, reverse transcriptase zinc-binding domain protein n=1 Tax=Tanacetum coccineum TaxID=301880 RepID=A0ABQ5DSQ9_9ASTR